MSSGDYLDTYEGKEPWAAYVVGHHSCTLRIWQCLFWKAPAPETNTFDGVPLTVEEMTDALVQLAHEINPGVLQMMRSELEALLQLNEAMWREVQGLESESATTLFQGREAPGKLHCQRLRKLAPRAFPRDTTLALWLSFGRSVGACFLELYDLPSNAALPSVVPIIRLAKSLVENAGQPITPIKRLAESQETLDSGGPLKWVGEVVGSPERLPQFDDADLDAYSLMDGIRLLDADIQEALQLGDIGPSVPRANAPRESTKWCHTPDEARPDEFRFGTLDGTKKDLACWLLPPTGKQDPRALETAGATGRYWIVRHDRTHFEVFFRSRERYTIANQERLRKDDTSAHPA